MKGGQESPEFGGILASWALAPEAFAHFQVLPPVHGVPYGLSVAHANH